MNLRWLIDDSNWESLMFSSVCLGKCWGGILQLATVTSCQIPRFIYSSFMITFPLIQYYISSATEAEILYQNYKVNANSYGWAVTWDMVFFCISTGSYSPYQTLAFLNGLLDPQTFGRTPWLGDQSNARDMVLGQANTSLVCFNTARGWMFVCVLHYHLSSH
jgi:hypothetical protein